MKFKNKFRGVDDPSQRIFPELNYFEEQYSLYCAVHAINNLAQMSLTNEEELSMICKRLKIKDKQSHCNRDGDYSVDVIVTYFRLNKIPVLVAISICPFRLNQCMNDIILNVIHTDSIYGFIVSNGRHWIAIRLEKNIAIWIDSEISDFFLRYEIDTKDGLDALLRNMLSYYSNNPLLGFVTVFNPRSPETKIKYEETETIIEDYLSFEIDMNLFPR
jgi:hypothetical protein